ncbi:MAG: matrixin family metalloprotease [Patescibacteria group bacterium]
MRLSWLSRIFTREVKVSRRDKNLSPELPPQKQRRTKALGSWQFLMFLAVAAVVTWWWVNGNVCGLPIKYTIGQVDNRFGLSEAEMLQAIRAAESWWEGNLDQDLFEYDPKGEYILTINLVYDSRQQATQEFQRIENDRTDLEDDLAEIVDEYEELKSVFERRDTVLSEMNRVYDERLAIFERTVDSWNNRGGAPPDVYDELQQEQDKLGSLVDEINGLVNQQNELAARINALADTESETVQGFNEVVHDFNETFAAESSEEEEQGIYGSGTINVYQYDNQTDLIMLLAHEMGHALGLGHVDDPQAIMYFKKNDRQAKGDAIISDQTYRELTEKCNL